MNVREINEIKQDVNGGKMEIPVTKDVGFLKSVAGI